MIQRLVTVRVDTRDPAFQLAIELRNPKEDAAAILRLTHDEAMELEAALGVFKYQGSVTCITRDPNVKTDPKGGPS